MIEIICALILGIGLCFGLIIYLHRRKQRLKNELHAAKNTINSQAAQIEAAYERSLIEEANARLSIQEIDHHLHEQGWFRDDSDCQTSHSHYASQDMGSCNASD